MEVQAFDGPGDAWDRFVRECDGWTHMHLFGWREILETTYRHDCPYLAAFDGGEMRGVLPLVSVRSPLFGKFLVSMPFLNYGGPLGDPRAIEVLVREAIDRSERTGVDLLELRCRNEIETTLPDSGRKITVTLPLTPGEPERLWDSFTSKFRTKIRRADKEGFEARFGPDQVEPFYEVFCRLMRELGTPTPPRELFEAISRTFGSSSWFGCAYHEGEPVAGGCALVWGSEIEMTWSGSRRSHNHLRPNPWLYWQFMERACLEGLETFNFGRCTPDSGTHDYKRSWPGSIDEPLHWYYRSADGRAATPVPDDPGLAWGPRIWRRLPLRLTNALGPHIIRLIP